MRRLVSFVLVAVILFQMFGFTITCIDFSLNKAYIVANLCENKSEPSRKCHGHCYLRKKLAMQERNEQLPAGTTAYYHEFQLFHTLPEFSFDPITPIQIIFNAYSASGGRMVSGRIFKPPIDFFRI